MKNHSISRKTILKTIFEDFISAFQWGNPHVEHRLSHFNNAEALIQLLEADDCGSHGGYDPKNPCLKITGFKLFDRFLTVLRKYNEYDDLEEFCGETVETLIEVAKRDITR